MGVASCLLDDIRMCGGARWNVIIDNGMVPIIIRSGASASTEGERSGGRPFILVGDTVLTSIILSTIVSALLMRIPIPG